MLRASALAFLVASGPFTTSTAQACTVCFELPRDSVADRIIDADLVVILREDPERPFHYSVHEVLAGPSANVPPPPFLVDAVMRARLSANPNDGALATWTTIGGWQLHGHATPAFQDVARGVVAASSGWSDPAEDRARFDFFAALHASTDPAVQELALIELARLPYAFLRDLRPGLDRQQVARRLVDPQYMEWAPIYILILGQSDDPADHAFVRRAAKAALSPGSRRSLAAWVTAWIEIDGVQAVDAILQDHVSDRSLSESDVRALALALAEHVMSGDPEVASRALTALEAATAQHPAAAGIAARTFLQLKDWSLVETLARQIGSGEISAPDEVFIVEAYLASARDAATTAPDTALIKN
jgi:hypothetical protein